MKQPLTWKWERRGIKDLLPANYNPRKMTPSERKDLEASIREFGTVVPVAVNTGKRDGILIGGHQRVTIYADLGIDTVDVMVPSRELTLEEEKKLNLRLNKNVGSWDMEKLKDFDMGMLLNIGFSQLEVTGIFDIQQTPDDNFDVEDALKKATKTKIKRGDMFKLGTHTILCGDATEETDLKKLMGGGPGKHGIYGSALQR